MKLVFLHGPPASGKLTVARALSKLTGIAVFHNHLIVDALGPVFAFGSEPFVRLREQFWLAVFDDAAKAGRSLIFTFAPERTVSAHFVDDVVRAVEAAGGEVCFVRLTLSDAEQERRLDDPSRREHGKLISLELLRRLRESGAFEFGALPEGLTIDSGTTAPESAAEAIRTRFALS